MLELVSEKSMDKEIDQYLMMMLLEIFCDTKTELEKGKKRKQDELCGEIRESILDKFVEKEIT